ncbi:MAG: 16S rRNA (cytosine(1402)-N(4))-methyltransferase [Candidatus Taylorbacteria bacterium RIFCSPHIGHO2_02_FULL_45_28]|uniref:Ribosomal RNA small subunit methyltransferase H n=1 Tax=Candidatus Taylorbacteria bacterium RIFCSPHIGHO2_12_FULL_45_16 TaxID=1802315 RepID=A0A1G2MZL1_9BACT|nr:MAG: 16S rRNA (cytosine(1402)-N(4))-methyltransferase [Candidatus Taylorbacteria bacterium RIFCSPHIGHO2_01_FULL_44_110]OHA25624.1 MAG: 16S rRNA (cytosine(1402)-N(4))-methyltransferase [Candidatus Taylorbacteria bacterium RIFCSPHIGHO2_02_FULL_45_28]OHA29290.1 MAG: 16S rRNA (cytosine(1402)-N(4))-methyltransferase [Candidatus Taylorbacteria bacterium RIFCSPHIGHO2_12_FULL_45_16]OHA33512.1 MAG: 16S rRNA (cytosine(1402)-N(4))-methyltransferase [Candidatus Taylorbacteria bacterium RIFCSPLOWO2_01_FUL
MNTVHTPVLLHEVIVAMLPIKSKVGPQTYLDGTLGGAGHALMIAKSFEGKLTIIGLDRDPQAIFLANEALKGKAERIILENEDYRDLDKVLDRHQIAGVDMMLLDLGVSSDELENSGKGFTFQKDEPLLMTMGDPSRYPFVARDIINNWAEEDIANVIFGYGEERFARRIARTLIAYRVKKKIETSGELAEIVKSATPGFYKRGTKIHPATKTFQALRIAVNDELNALREGLTKGYARLNPRGRMAIIAFHSLEDRIVKDFYKKKAIEGARIITKKPIMAGDQEKTENPRSRSAKLRVIEKI